MSAQMISHSRKRIIQFFNKKILLSNFPEKSEAWMTREHMNIFCSWLRKHIMHNMDISKQLFLLSRRPSWNILTYQGYEINENTFYTTSQDKMSTNQNSGSIWMPQVAMEKGDILRLHWRDMRIGLRTQFQGASVLVPVGKAHWSNKRSVRDNNCWSQRSWVPRRAIRPSPGCCSGFLR